MVPGGPGTPSEPGIPGRPGGPWERNRPHIISECTSYKTKFSFIRLGHARRFVKPCKIAATLDPKTVVSDSEPIIPIRVYVLEDKVEPHSSHFLAQTLFLVFL